MKEKWTEYKSDKIPKGKYEVNQILQNEEGTIIELESELHTLTIMFEFTDAVRISDEGRRIRTYNGVSDIQPYRETFFGNPLYEVMNSEFCEWLIIESAGFYTDFKHYAIMTINDIVDIVSSVPPVIQINNI